MGERVLLVGNGAREHILAATLCKNPAVELVAYMAHDNPGILKLATKHATGPYGDLDAIAQFAREARPAIAVIGPEAPLAAGVADLLEDMGIPCVGPRQQLAQLETSKAFARQLLERHDIPGNPRFSVFTTPEGIAEWIGELQDYVVKADGLHGGKGVKVSGAHLASSEEGVAYAEACLETDGTVVIEERLEGEEFSLMAFTDGKTVAAMPCVQDHKRAHDGDNGPNTGGMGSYSAADHKLPFLLGREIEEALAIIEKTCAALAKEHGSYHGIVYGGFMATKDGVKLIEYNARLGDPEAMNVLTLLETDLFEICKAITQDRLSAVNVQFAKRATVCKYVVPNGYPEAPEKGTITINEGSADCYYASVRATNNSFELLGSRAVAVVGIGSTIEEAEQKAEKAASAVSGPVFHRKDIGTSALIEQRIAHMQRLR